MERMELAFEIFAAETFQGLSFRRSRKSKIRAVAAHLAVFHQFLQQGVGVAAVGVGVFLHRGIHLVGSDARL